MLLGKMFDLIIILFLLVLLIAFMHYLVSASLKSGLCLSMLIGFIGNISISFMYVSSFGSGNFMNFNTCYTILIQMELINFRFTAYKYIMI